MTFSILTLRKITFNILTLCTMTLSRITLIKITLSLMILVRMTLGIMSFNRVNRGVSLLNVCLINFIWLNSAAPGRAWQYLNSRVALQQDWLYFHIYMYAWIVIFIFKFFCKKVLLILCDRGYWHMFLLKRMIKITILLSQPIRKCAGLAIVLWLSHLHLCANKYTLILIIYFYWEFLPILFKRSINKLSVKIIIIKFKILLFNHINIYKF